MSKSFISVIPQVDWFPHELSAWTPPEALTVSEWAEKHRVLPIRQAAEPGPWRNERAPYTVEVMDAFVDPHVERISIMASAQASKTESIYNMIGYAICQDPSPCLVVMPTLVTLKRVAERIRLMIEDSSEIASHITGDPDDLKKTEIVLDRMTLYFVTAGSTADLRNIQARFVIMDEVDDYPPEAGDQGSPVEMAESRATTFWNRKIIEACTPTTETGYINKGYQKSNKCKFWVPCPYCGCYQVLSLWQIKHQGEKLGEWPKDKRDPEYLKQDRVARYECERCHAEIDDKDKPRMLRLGTWVPEGHPIDKKTGAISWPRPNASHVGFWWNALYSPWRTFSEIAAQFFATKNDPAKYKTFVNLWLAEPWVERVEVLEEEKILKKRCDLAPLVVPREAIVLTCGIDVQKHGFYFTTWAWTRELESWLIHYGFLPEWDDVFRLVFKTAYLVDDSTDTTMSIWRAAIDTGGGESGQDWSRTEDVYAWLRGNGQGIVWGIKGLSKNTTGTRIRHSVLDKMPGRQGQAIPGGLVIWLLDTAQLKDAFFWRLSNESGDPQPLHLHAETGLDFAKHLLAEEKRRNKQGRFEWVQVRKDNHYLDASIYGHACADPQWLGGVRVLSESPSPGSQPRVLKSRWMSEGLI